MIAGRGFWPGLCVSLKHNSRFASFAILAKGDYPAELDIPIPFALISNDTSKDELVVMPAYWFLHNMYALARNAWKYTDRDKRIEKTQLLEFDFLAPDTITEITEALVLLRRFTGKAFVRQGALLARQSDQNKAPNKKHSLLASRPSRSSGPATSEDEEFLRIGKDLLDNSPNQVDELEILADGWENSDRKVRLVKISQAYTIFQQLIVHYAADQLLTLIRTQKIKNFEAVLQALPASLPLHKWVNAGGQLIRESELEKLIRQIHSGKVREWEQVHQFYTRQGENYAQDKLLHALAALKEVQGISLRRAGKEAFRDLLLQSIATKEWMTKNIYSSRAKDYTNPFRTMVYNSPEEMNTVIGRLQDNGFIRQEKTALKKYQKEVEEVIKKFKL